jgi:hypothetical protein
MTKNLLATMAAPVIFAAAAMVPAMAHTSNTNDWVPYTATYNETYTNPGQPQRIALTTESRSSDGSLLTMTQDNGRKSGKLWKSSGDLYSLDFINNHAVYQRNYIRKHLQIPSVAPLRSDVVAGVSCTVYPVGVHNGTGSLCIDTTRDIMVREEIHTTQPQGKMDLVKEITSVDFSKPGPNETIGVPAGFVVLNPTKAAK